MDINTAIVLNNKVAMPQIGMGVWQSKDGKETESAVLWALEKGYRHIDTAAIYGNERSVGSAITLSGIPRNQLFIVTKLWNDHHKDVAAALNQSLQKLGLDYIDLYLMHFPVPSRNESWKIMEKLYHEGKAKAIGVSNFTVRHLKELLNHAQIVPTVNQVEFHPYLYHKELLDFCREKGIQLEAYSPLTHGKKLKDKLLHDIAGKYNKSSAQLLIRWGLQHNVVVIPKSVKKDRIIENADVFDFEISQEDMEILDGLNENFRTCWDPTNAP